MTRANVMRLSAEMTRCLDELRLIVETALGKIRQALELTIVEIRCIEEILRLEETQRNAREEPERGLTPFRATWTPVFRN